MSLLKANKITKQEYKPPTEEEKHLWILGSPKIITTKMESLDASTVMSKKIQQKIVENQRRKKRLESAISITKQHTLQKATYQNRR